MPSQLASALALQEQLGTEESVVMVASDKRLLAAAITEGLTTWNPETSSTPPARPVN